MMLGDARLMPADVAIAMRAAKRAYSTVVRPAFSAISRLKKRRTYQSPKRTDRKCDRDGFRRDRIAPY